MIYYCLVELKSKKYEANAVDLFDTEMIFSTIITLSNSNVSARANI